MLSLYYYSPLLEYPPLLFTSSKADNLLRSRDYLIKSFLVTIVSSPLFKVS